MITISCLARRGTALTGKKRGEFRKKLTPLAIYLLFRSAYSPKSVAK
jgi:hypothetical protein